MDCTKWAKWSERLKNILQQTTKKINKTASIDSIKKSLMSIRKIKKNWDQKNRQKNPKRKYYQASLILDTKKIKAKQALVQKDLCDILNLELFKWVILGLFYLINLSQNHWSCLEISKIISNNLF